MLKAVRLPKSFLWPEKWLTLSENAEIDHLQVLETRLRLCMKQKKLRDLAETANENTNSDHEANDEIMEVLSKIEHFGEQFNSIIARLGKLDSIESSVRNIETNLSDIQMFRDLPREIIKRRKDQMVVFKEARRQGMRAVFQQEPARQVVYQWQILASGQTSRCSRTGR